VEDDATMIEQTTEEHQHDSSTKTYQFLTQDDADETVGLKFSNME